MSVVDLRKVDQPSEVEADVCIVGAGAAGLFLAAALAKARRQVVILEAGDKVCSGATTLDFLPVFTGAEYLGATLGRAFGLGGSTSRWGGLLIPHSVHDVSAASAETATIWRHIVATVETNTGRVLHSLGFSVGGDFHQFAPAKLGRVVNDLDAAGVATLSAQFMPLSKRHFGYLLTAVRELTTQPLVFLNAVCNRWQMGASADANGRVAEVGAVSNNGRTVTVKAKEVVVAAGTIESTRILLELTALHHLALVSTDLGACLSDHLSCPVATVEPKDYAAVASRFRPRFSGPCLRTFRFVEKQPRPGSPRYFCHFIFDLDNAALTVAKEAIAALQGKRLPRFKVGQVLSAPGGLIALLFARYARSRLYIPSGSPVHLQLDIEQSPDTSNRIVLGDERDACDRRRAHLHWRITEQDSANIRHAARRMLAAWPAQRVGLPELHPSVLEGDAAKPYDAYHPVGTCRMGDDAKAVVDLELRVKGTANLSVLSTAILPSAGTANPTFTLLCFAEALADRLTKRLEA